MQLTESLGQMSVTDRGGLKNTVEVDHGIKKSN